MPAALRCSRHLSALSLIVYLFTASMTEVASFCEFYWKCTKRSNDTFNMWSRFISCEVECRPCVLFVLVLHGVICEQRGSAVARCSTASPHVCTHSRCIGVLTRTVHQLLSAPGPHHSVAQLVYHAGPMVSDMRKAWRQNQCCVAVEVKQELVLNIFKVSRFYFEDLLILLIQNERNWISRC